MTAALVIAAAANVVVKVLQFQKQSGEVGLEFSALNVKLDQVLRNRVLTLQAISDLDDDIKIMTSTGARITVRRRTAGGSKLVKACQSVNRHSSPRDRMDCLWPAILSSRRDEPAPRCEDGTY